MQRDKKGRFIHSDTATPRVFTKLKSQLTGLSMRTIQRRLQLAEAIEKYPILLKCKTEKEALELLRILEREEE